MTVRIVRCECFEREFSELLAIARKENVSAFEDLQEITEFGLSCRLCNPYVRRMLATGETVFTEILDDAPAPKHDSLFDSAEFNRTLFYPRRSASEPPPGAVDTFVAVPGASLHLRTHHAANARATVLFFHGNGEVVSDYDHIAPHFAGIGASLAVVDYRGYGRSTGGPSLRSITTDAAIVLAAVAARPLIVMGRSLGSACAVELYAARPSNVAGFVLESGYSDLAGLIDRRRLPRAPAISPEDRALFDPVPKLARGLQPLLVLHGARDTLIAPREAEVAFAAAGSADKELVLVEGHGHNDISIGAAYWTALARFIAAAC